MKTTTYAHLSKKNLLSNINIFKNLAKNSQIIAMIKANAYGHGLRTVALSIEPYVSMLGVARIEEALALRKVHIKIPILLMEGVFDKEEFFQAESQNFQVVLHNDEQINWLKQVSLKNPINIWLKINTGMGRLGFEADLAQEIFSFLLNNSQVKKPIGIMSHLACAHDQNHPLNKQQFENFINFTKDKTALKSINNSPGVINFSEFNYDFIRPGLGLYGACPVNHKNAKDLKLKPVMTLKAKIIAIHQMKKGTFIGYGARFICPKDMRVGVLAIGYGDGYPRTAKDGTPMLINDTICQLIGKVSMDMLTVDLSKAPNAKVGDFATLWGEGLPIDDVAPYTQNCAYDLFCGIQNRVIFEWVE